MSPDYSPLMGPTEVDGFLVTAGWGTWGFKAIPAGGVGMAELVATGRAAGDDRAVPDRPVPRRPGRSRPQLGRNALMGFKLDCPRCGPRSYHEFWFGGELRPYDPAPPTKTTTATRGSGQRRRAAAERWFHFAGCRRWLTVERDTQTNGILDRLEVE